MLKFIKKYLKFIISGLVFLTVLAGALIYNSNLNEIEDVTWEYWNKGDERRGELVIKYTIEDSRDRKYVLQDFFNLKSQVVYKTESQDYGRNPKIRFETFYLERTGINSFEVKESIVSTTTKYTFDEAVELAKEYDIYKDNPAPDKIYSYPELNDYNPDEDPTLQEEIWYGYNEEDFKAEFNKLDQQTQDKIKKELEGEHNNQVIVKYLIDNGYIPAKE